LNRSVWRALYERDIDHLLLGLLHSDPTVVEAFVGHVLNDQAFAPVAFLGAWHSVLDRFGHESDLVAEFRLADGRTLLLLIEDKIDAACQPNQARRYVERARSYVKEGRADVSRVVLVAPAGYPARMPEEDTRDFDRHISFEQLQEWMVRTDAPSVNRYWHAMLDHAVLKWSRVRRPGIAKIEPTDENSGGEQKQALRCFKWVEGRA
jgi:hypothetical protein